MLFTNSTSTAINNYEVFAIDYLGKETIYSLCKYPDIIWKYIHTQIFTKAMIRSVDDDTKLLHDLSLTHITEHSIQLKVSQLWLRKPSKYLTNTQLVEVKYDSYLKEWLGKNKWKLIYRASEHGYTASSFHDYCDDKGPTLIVVKSTDGWIFGGYTTQSWHPIKLYTKDDIICIFYCER